MRAHLVLFALLALPGCGNQDAETTAGSNPSSATPPVVQPTISGRPATQFVLRKDMFEALTKPAMATVAQTDWLSADDLVLGLVSAAEARAYPLRQMAYHHVVNDVVGERAVLVTFCSLSGNVLVCDRAANGQVDEFGVAGWLQGTLLLYDKRAGSTWSQVTGRCIDGFRKGERLERIGQPRLVAWQGWQATEPTTRVMRPRADWADRYPAVADWLPGSDYIPAGVRATLDAGVLGPDAHAVVIAFESDGDAHMLRVPDADTRARVVQIAGRALLLWRVSGPFDVRVFVWPDEFAGASVSASGDRLRMTVGSLVSVLGQTGMCESGPARGTQLESFAYRVIERYAWLVHHDHVIAHDD